jgi:transcriptional regulator with XRE-family HTH domain
METEQWVDRERAVWKQFPLHPQPEPLESFTSYIIRLAEANGLQSLNELATLAGMSWSRLSASPDYPYPRNEGLAQIAGCTEAKLESATFLHLAQRFGCPLHLQPLRRFLQSSLAPTLRYCPRCLAEQPSAYYSLIWRFLAVQGCARHNCVLLDNCGHCGDLLPNVPRCPRLGWCLSCHGNLRTCQAPSLTMEAAQSVRVQASTLELLLSQEQRKLDGKPTVAIGKCFAMLRQDRHLSMTEVAYLSGKDEQIILEIESGNPNRKASFDDYVRYAESLASSLKTIVEMLPFQEGLPTDEEGLLKLVDETAQHLQAQGKPRWRILSSI